MSDPTAFALISALIALYMLPTLIALVRDHPQGVPIFILNLTLGWTVIVWTLLLAWSCASYQRR